MIAPLAVTRGDVASYLDDLIWVYTLVIFAYIVVQIALNMGFRPPYARWTDAVLEFLRETVEPYLRIFRRVIPPLGPLDLSPWVAVIVLRVVGSLLTGLIRG